MQVFLSSRCGAALRQRLSIHPSIPTVPKPASEKVEKKQNLASPPLDRTPLLPDSLLCPTQLEPEEKETSAPIYGELGEVRLGQAPLCPHSLPVSPGAWRHRSATAGGTSSRVPALQGYMTAPALPCAAW